MTTRAQKAILTRTKRLSEAFLTEHNRQPTLTELNDLYAHEMRLAADKSSRNQAGTGYFAQLKEKDPELLKELTSQGGKKSKRGKGKN